MVKKNQAVDIMAGDTINIVHVEANYQRGLSVDILGYGSLNDFKKDFSIYKNTTMIIRKDNKVFAKIPIITRDVKSAHVQAQSPGAVSHFVIEVNGMGRILRNGQTLDVVRGDLIRIMNILPQRLEGQKNLCVNFKGFVGNWANNTGEDRGYVIDTGRDLLARYSLYGQKRVYRIVASQGEEIVGQMLVKIAEPSLEYLILKLNDQTYALRDGERVSAEADDCLTVIATKSNIGEEKEIRARANGYPLSPGDTKRIGDIVGRNAKTLRIDLERKNLPLGRVFIELG